MKFERFGRLFVAIATSAVLVCAALLNTACEKRDTQGGPTGQSDAGLPKEIKVGIYMPMTGPTATFGTSSVHGFQMAADELNAAGGINGSMVKLIVEDDQGKPDEAKTVVTKLISKDQVVAVLGEVGSSRSIAAAPICQQNKVPMLTPSSTNEEVTKKGDYIFRVCYIDPFQGEVGARFAFETLKFKKAAILTDIKNDYSVGLSKTFKEAFTKMGGQIVVEQTYQEGDTNFNAQLTGIRAANPEFIYAPGYYTDIGQIAKQARELGIKNEVPLIGGDGWDSPKLWEGGKEALNGCFFSNHYSISDPSEHVQKFIKSFQEKYKGETPDALAALAYDGAKVLFDAMKRANSVKGDKVRDELAKTQSYKGVTGLISINKDRNAVKSAVILEVRDGKYVYKDTIAPPGMTAEKPAAAEAPKTAEEPKKEAAAK
ncbi:MAG: ABC transporter substrate-binding protein [Blastocatellia bacterium]|nr:ABC transporter substrate-binding protein [Blastocatellia bacterium]